MKFPLLRSLKDFGSCYFQNYYPVQKRKDHGGHGVWGSIFTCTAPFSLWRFNSHFIGVTTWIAHSKPKCESQQCEQWNREHQHECVYWKDVAGDKHHLAAGIFEEIRGGRGWRLREDMPLDQLFARVFPGGMFYAAKS